MKKKSKDTKINIKNIDCKFSIKQIINIFKYELIIIMLLYAIHEMSHVISPYLMSQQYQVIEAYYKNKDLLNNVYWINIKNTIYWCCVLIFGGACKMYGGIVFNRIEQKVKYLVFSYFHNLPYEDFVTIQGEKAFSYLKSIESNVREIISIFIMHLFANVWTIIVNICILTYMVPKLGIVAIVWIAIHLLFVKLTFHRNRGIAKKVFVERKQMFSSILESFLHILMIKVTNTKEYEIEKLSDQIQEFNKNNNKFIINAETLQIYSGVIGELLLWGCGMYVIIQSLNTNPMPVSNIIYLVMVMYGLVGRTKNIGVMMTKFIEALAEYKLNMEMLSQYKPHHYETAVLHYKENTPAVKMKNVSFTLNDNHILKNISLEIKQGEKVCFIGHSGSGKSTMMNLLTGIYKQYTGVIEIYGQNTKNIALEGIIDHFSIINQAPMLLNRTVRENLVQNKNVCQKTIAKYCKMVQIDDFIQSLPHGYDTVIHGKNISGGQAQRLCLARMLLREKSFYIFDEATTGLDQKTKSMFLSAIFDMLSNYEGKKDTMIFIDHSLAFLHKVDRIIMMEQGRIIFDGNYESLKKNPIFLSLQNAAI